MVYNVIKVTDKNGIYYTVQEQSLSAPIINPLLVSRFTSYSDAEAAIKHFETKVQIVATIFGVNA